MTNIISDNEVQAIREQLMELDSDDSRMIYPHVDFIDGIKVIVNIAYYPTKHQQLFFEVSAGNVYKITDDEDDDDDLLGLFRSKNVKMKGEGLAEEDVRFILLEIMRFAAILKFDKLCGCFRTYSVEDKPAIYISGSDCVVCLQKTKFVAACCTCRLCVNCFQHLARGKKCPICRELAMVIHIN